MPRGKENERCDSKASAAAHPKQTIPPRPLKTLSGPNASNEPARLGEEDFDHSPTTRLPKPRETDKPREDFPSSVISPDKHSQAHTRENIAAPAEKSSDVNGPRAPSEGRHFPPLPRPDNLTEKALAKLAKQLRPIQKKQPTADATDIDRYQYETESSEPRLSDVESLDSVELFNRKYGYLPPLGEEAAKVLAFVLENPTLAHTMDRTGPERSERFTLGLESRGVKLKGSKSPDSFVAELQCSNVENFLPEPKDEKVFNERLWALDQLKCTSTSSEALFQRTLMLSIIARHFLIYQSDPTKVSILDFSVEELWTCLPMPTKALWATSSKEQGPKLLTQPNPDLSLSFNRQNLITDDIWEGLPAATRHLGCLENKTKGASRVFHFLTIEGKSAEHSVDDEKALLQCLNNSSQALFNLYAFFHDAGPDHEEVFFSKVRVFSIVAMRRGFLMRCHRGVRLDDHMPISFLVLPDQPTYRVRYEYEEVIRIPESNDHNREQILGLLKMVLRYAIEDLAKYIRNAAKTLFENFCLDSEALKQREDPNFYRLGQPSPEDMRKAKASRSQTSHATPRSLNTPKCATGPTGQPATQSQESGSQKRRRKRTHAPPVDAADDDSEEAQEGALPPRKNPRRAPARQRRNRLAQQSNSDEDVSA